MKICKRCSRWSTSTIHQALRSKKIIMTTIALRKPSRTSRIASTTSTAWSPPPQKWLMFCLLTTKWRSFLSLSQANLCSSKSIWRPGRSSCGMNIRKLFASRHRRREGFPMIMCSQSKSAFSIKMESPSTQQTRKTICSETSSSAFQRVR